MAPGGRGGATERRWVRGRASQLAAADKIVSRDSYRQKRSLRNRLNNAFILHGARLAGAQFIMQQRGAGGANKRASTQQGSQSSACAGIKALTQSFASEAPESAPPGPWRS
jgi:hypothetical protein